MNWTLWIVQILVVVLLIVVLWLVMEQDKPQGDVRDHEFPKFPPTQQ